jgi:phosphatidylserine/phosphatidylglycerophosphate/cardiolipin synthase-like enzyme
MPQKLLIFPYLLVALFFAYTGYADTRSYPAQVTVYFSPNGGATDAIVRELDRAQRSIVVQAYSFTSAPIAKALLAAHARGVNISVVLDKSNQTDKYSAATFLANANIPMVIDAEHAIAHNKVMVIDTATVLTGSFNFTKAAEERNAENLLVLKGSPDLAQAYTVSINGHASHSHPYQPTTASAVPAQEKRVPLSAGAIYGNRKSKVYHLPGCPGYGRMSQATVISFANEADAVQAGYRKAKNCP